ncbi:MAG: polysaccharide biosynthesis tyrosine autokinase [Deltaproteobacteria bacterium]|nr:polysaccharide biosynthesis tyrosine autokinase [Deltaproteobacteria bacterium]
MIENPRLVNSDSIPGDQSETVDLRELWIVILKRRWAIIIFFLIIMTIVMIYTLKQPKIYQAIASIVIEPQAPEVLSGVREVVDLGTGGYWTNKEFYETQYNIIKSRSIAKRVVDKLGLDKDAHFLGLDNIKDPKERERVAKKIDPVKRLISKITVEPVKNSRMVYIKVEDTNPEFAALLANSIASAYMEANLDIKLDATRSAGDWLSDQLQDLKEKVEKSETALHNFKKEHNILSVSLEDNQNMLSQRLRSLSEALNKMEVQKIELKSMRDIVIKVRDDPSKIDSLDMITQNSLIQRLKEEYVKARNTFLDIAERYGEKHQKYQVAKKQLELIESNIKQEMKNIIESFENKYLATVNAINELKRAIEETKQQAMDLNKLEVDYIKLKRDADNNLNLYQIVLKRQKETDLTGLLKANNVRKLDSALVPTSPIKPKLNINLLVGALIGIFGGIALAFFLERVDNTIKTQEDIERYLKLPFLGLIPLIKEDDTRVLEQKGISKDLFIIEFPKSSVAESCRAIRTNLMFLSAEKRIKSIVVTSAGPQEGKTITVTSLAIALAQTGKKTLIVDTDMRRPRIHKAFNIENTNGISNFLISELSLLDVAKPSGIPNLFICPCGPIPPNPAELMYTQRFKEFVREAKESFDIVLFDSPPVAAVTDGVVISKIVDGVIIVGKAKKTTRNALLQVKKQLKDVNAHIIGMILNEIDLESKEYNYYYYSYYYRHYGYYYGAERYEKDKKRLIGL